MVKERKNLGLGLLPIAALFLFNPPLAGFVDVLPDIIGYLLFFIGLRDVADLNYHMEEALASFRRMILVSGFQLLSVFWVFGFCTPKERPVSILLVVFTVSVLELIFAGKAFRELFEGFLYLGSRHSSTAVFRAKGSETRTNDEKNATTSMAAFTWFFIIAKATFSVLPELASLTLDSYDERNPLRFLYDYISLLRTFAMLILLTVCIAWLIKFWKYIRSILRDTPFMSELTEKYRAEILPKEDIFLKRAIRVGTVVLSLGICFSLDIYIDYISVFPDFICPTVMLIGFFLLKPYIGKGSFFPLCAAANLVSSAAVYFYSVYFYDHFTMSLALFSEKAMLAYHTFCILKITDSVFFFAMMFSLLPALRHIIENYTGFAPLSAANFNSADKLKQVHGELNKRVTVLYVLSTLCAIGSILYILLVRTVTFIWLVEFLLCLTFVLCFINTLSAITNEVETKYLLS